MQTIIVKKCLMAFYFGLQVGIFADFWRVVGKIAAIELFDIKGRKLLPVSKNILTFAIRNNNMTENFLYCKFIV